MNRLLWRLIFVANFGRNSPRPYRAALQRLAVAVGAAVVLGVLLGRAAATAPVPRDLPLVWAAGLVGLAAYSFTGLILFSLSAGRGQHGHRQIMQKLYTVWPLGRRTQWLMQVVPTFMVGIIILILGTPVIIALAHAAGLPVLPLAAVHLLGTLAGLSLMLATWPQKLMAKAALLIAYSAAGVWLLEQSVQFMSYRLSYLPAAGVYLILLVSLTGLEQSYRCPLVPFSGAGSGRTILKLPQRSNVAAGWFMLKLLRNHRSLISLGFCGGLIGLTALAVTVKHLNGPHPEMWLMLSGLLTGAVGCDIRGLSARYKAPEIEGLSGPGYFVRHQIGSTLIIALIIPLPMLLAVLAARPEQAVDLGLFYLGVQAGAVLTGLLASTIFVPRDGDLGSQLFAVMLSTTILLALPKLGHFSAYSLAAQAAIWTGIASTAAVLVSLIEINRRQYHATLHSST